MRFVLGVLIAIALVLTLVSLMLGSIFGINPMFAALGQTLAIVGAATFAWWLGRNVDLVPGAKAQRGGADCRDGEQTQRR